MKCRRCGAPTPRLTVAQRYCPQCAREVKAILAVDEKRRQRPTWAIKDFTGTTPL